MDARRRRRKRLSRCRLRRAHKQEQRARAASVLTQPRESLLREGRERRPPRPERALEGLDAAARVAGDDAPRVRSPRRAREVALRAVQEVEEHTRARLFTADMTYYETPAGAKVFAAGAFSLADDVWGRRSGS